MTDLIYKLSTIVASTALVASLGLGLCQSSSPSMSKASSGISKSSDSSISSDTAANIALGEEEFSPEKEIYFIDTSDRELAHYLSFLHPRAVAFLYSCSTAQELNCESEKKCEGNLAQNFSFWAAGRYVLAAREDLSTAQVKVISYYPFNAILLNETGTRDITFRSSINS